MNKLKVLQSILNADNITKSIIENENSIFEIIPILKYEKGFDQNSAWHCYDVWNHTIKAIENSPRDFEIRLVLLLHDIGKPFSYQDENGVRHFKNHANKSKEIAKTILEKLGYKDELLNELLFLIGNHATTIDYNKINETNIDLYMKLITIQICDGSAYEENHAKEIVAKLYEVKEKIENMDIKKLQR